MGTLNLGILAHVDAGKTTLTERLLYAAGVIDEIGSVDNGSTQTDSLALERRRGITIKSAVVSFPLDDVTINLVDTPGHPDFVAEVERVLNVLDGAVLVISAVEGVQPQTRILLRALRRLRIPTLLFVNKIDRRGADHVRVLEGISARLTSRALPMGSVSGIGTRNASFTPYAAADAGFTDRAHELLADHDDALLAAYVDGETPLPYPRLRGELAAQAKRALIHPVLFGSAITGAGAGALIAGIKELLPASEGDTDGPVSGTVFKVERGPAGERIAYARMFSGTVRNRDRVRFGGDDGRAGHGKVTTISVFDRGASVPRATVEAGQIGTLRGLGDIRIGDAIGGEIGRPSTSAGHRYFPPPTLETVVIPRRSADMGELHLALTQLAEQDPLINVRQDDIRREISVSLYGEVQKEVIASTLADEFGIDVEFRETTTICIERPIGTGAAVEFNGRQPNPFLATVGLLIEPAPVGTGARYRREVGVHGTMPPAFFAAVEETVHETLRQGIYGWQVTDCVVSMTHSGYSPRQSHAHQGFDKSMSSTGADFCDLTPLVVMSALRRAGTKVYEPIHRIDLEIPADMVAQALPGLAQMGAAIQATTTQGSACLLQGEIPAARVHALRGQLPALTHGEGVLESSFAHYAPVRGPLPTRPRSDNNPLNRKEYLLRVTRRTSMAPG